MVPWRGGIWGIRQTSAAGADAVLGQPGNLLLGELGQDPISGTQAPTQGLVSFHGSRDSSLGSSEGWVEVIDRQGWSRVCCRWWWSRWWSRWWCWRVYWWQSRHSLGGQGGSLRGAERSLVGGPLPGSRCGATGWCTIRWDRAGASRSKGSMQVVKATAFHVGFLNQGVKVGPFTTSAIKQASSSKSGGQALAKIQALHGLWERVTAVED